MTDHRGLYSLLEAVKSLLPLMHRRVRPLGFMDKLYAPAYIGPMDESFIEEIAIADEYLTAIGRLMVNWNQLDGIFDLLLIKLMGCRMWDVRSHMVIVGMSFGNKVELVKSLAGVQSKAGEAFYDKLVNTTLPEISRLQGKRNAVAHNKWALGEGGVRGIRMVAKPKLKITDKLVPIEEIRADSAAMVSSMNEIFLLLPLEEFAEKIST